jgi:putative transposase
MPKRATAVILSEKEQKGLLQITKRHRSEQQVVLRARMVLAALACEAPAQAGRPISQWTGREIAAELKARGIVEHISPRHAARLLKKGASNRTGSATG